MSDLVAKTDFFLRMADGAVKYKGNQRMLVNNNAGIFKWAAVVFLCVHTLSGPCQGMETIGNGGRLSGQLVTSEGRPMESVVVTFFNANSCHPPTLGKIRRVPDNEVRANLNGEFQVQLPAGQYHIGALQRARDLGNGPPRPGEKYFFAMDAQRNVQTFTVKEDWNTVIGRITGFMPDHFPEFKQFFTVTGTVRDKEKRPFAGAWIIIWTEDSGNGRPRYVSEKTGADGRYQVNLPPGVTYYIGARDVLTPGRTADSNFIGSYSAGQGEDPADKIPGLTGEPNRQQGFLDESLPITGQVGLVVSGIDIVMEKLPTPGPPPGVSSDSAPANGPLAKPDKPGGPGHGPYNRLN